MNDQVNTSEQQLDVYTYALSKGAAFKVAANGREWMARCINPGCSSQHDAFSTQPEGKLTGRWAGYGAWMCRKCWDPAEIVTQRDGTIRKKGWGSIIDLVMVCEGMNFREAEQFILAYAGETVPLDRRPALRARMTDEQWYEKFLPYLKASLSSEYRQAVFGYAASRGLTAETATFLKFGFSVDPVMTGTSYRRISFLTLPWHKEDGTLYRKINRRNLHDPLPEDEDKYRLVEGCDHDELYLGYMLRQQLRPTFLVESELDAATVLQEAGDLVNVVATGSAEHGKGPLTESRLRRQPFVFVSFDDDEQGEKASAYWLSRLESAKCIRYKPLRHDANEMHTSGLSVRKWVEAGLTYFVPSASVAAAAAPHVQGDAPLPSRSLSDDRVRAIAARLLQAGISFRVVDGCLDTVSDFPISEKVGAFLSTYEPMLLAWMGEAQEAAQVSDDGLGEHQLADPLSSEVVTSWQREPPTNQERTPDFWTRLRARLGDFRCDDPPPQVRPYRRAATTAPFPCYELAEENGVKILKIVGMWHPQELRLLTEEEKRAYA